MDEGHFVHCLESEGTIRLSLHVFYAIQGKAWYYLKFRPEQTMGALGFVVGSAAIPFIALRTMQTIRKHRPATVRVTQV